MEAEKLYGNSADILVYRYDEHGEIEVLTGIRQHEPWKGHITVPFGGHAEPSDENILETALRETEEETGFLIRVDFFIGIYGPKRYHYGFAFDMALVAIDRDRSSVTHVFAGQVLDGTLKESTEQTNLRFVHPFELSHKSLCFDHARVLADFLVGLREIASGDTWRQKALALVK